MHRPSIRLIILAFLVLPSTFSFACGDLDLICQQREGNLNIELPNIPLPDPECRGDICRIAQGGTEEASRAINNLARELSQTPQAIEGCFSNINNCVTEILSAPSALLVQAYMDGLYRQSEGRTQQFSDTFIMLAQPFYDIDLRGVTYAENINTGHGMTVAYCDRIFFTHSGNLWHDKNELHLTLHELEHLVQCQKRGKRTFLTEYILKGASDIAQGRLNVHDVHDFEVAANAKADFLTNVFWEMIHPMGSTQTCHTQAGNCNIPPPRRPVGSPCTCSTPEGVHQGSIN